MLLLSAGELLLLALLPLPTPQPTTPPKTFLLLLLLRLVTLLTLLPLVSSSGLLVEANLNFFGCLGKRAKIAINNEAKRATEQISFGFSFNQMKEDLKRQLQIRYSENSSEVTRLLGGNPALYEPDQWRDWVQTIVGNPTIVTYTLASIADLIQDNPTMQQDMAQAIFDRNNTPR